MALASYAGLYFDYAEVNPSNGGSLRACFTKAPHRPTRGWGLVNDEAQWNVAKIPLMILAGADAIACEVRKHDLVYVLGASTKGNVILQAAALGQEDIVAALDRNPTKVGRTLPGSGIPIHDDRDFVTEPDANFLVLPYHFRRSILKRHAPGRFIFPLPNVSVVCA